MRSWSFRSLLLRSRVPLSVAACALWLAACGGSDGEESPDQQQVAAEDERQQALALRTATAATAPPASVCFFEGANYTGKSFCVSASATGMPSGFDNVVSSVKVPAGVRVVLFDGLRQTGTSLALTADTATLTAQRFDNITSSFTIGSTGATMPAGDGYYWSNPATWGGTKPAAGDTVVVPAGMNLVLDESTPALGVVTIEGTLRFRDGVTAELRASDIIVRGAGALRAGSSTAPFTGKATITLTNTTMTADPSGAGMGARGLLVYNGGTLALFGKPPAVPWTRLAAHAAAGATTLQLADSVSWVAGDQIVVAPTEWYPLNTNASQASHDAVIQTELRTLASSNGAVATLGTGLSSFKWGRLQYMTDSGLSLTPGTFTKPHTDSVSTLDERAEVGNLTRNIVIQGADDTLWRSNGFGGHVMVMHRSSTVNLDGVEFRRMGQAGRLGRYPLHWHLLSYNTSTGAELGDATGHFIRNSAIWNSRQRCIVVHGTNGVEVRNNICYDIKGHAIFLEDGVERRNVIEGNLVLRVRSPLDSQVIAEHERRDTAGGCGGASVGYWLTNPDNTVRRNVAADAQGNGFWLSYPTLPKKDHKKVDLRPQNLAHGTFEYNTARANGYFGIMLECGLKDDAGNVEVLMYQPTTDGKAYNYANDQRFALRGLASIKNRYGGYLNRVSVPDYSQFVLSGNLQRSVTGSVLAGTFKYGLFVANSLNDFQTAPSGFDPQLAIASYHSQVDITDNTFVGYANRGYIRKDAGWDFSSGTFGTDDYYIRAVEKGHIRNPNNKLVNSDPGYRAIPPHLQPGYSMASNARWTLSGAIWDPNGLVGAANRYWVIDHPFLKESSCTTVRSTVPLNTLANGLSCAGPYYGLELFWLNRGQASETSQWGLAEKLDVTRLNASGQTVGTWVVDESYTANMLSGMRHFAAVKGDRYLVKFPTFPFAAATKSSPTWLQFQVTNLLTSTDSVIVGVQYSGTTVPSRVFASVNPDYAKFSGFEQDSMLLTQATSLSALTAGAGQQYWQDKTNQVIWMKLVALPYSQPYAWAAPNSDYALYRAYYVRVEP